MSTAVDLQTSGCAVVHRLQMQIYARSLLVAGLVCFTAGFALFGAQLYAFEGIVALAAVVFSADGIVEGVNRRALSLALACVATLAVLAGALLVALAVPVSRAIIDAVVAWDPLIRLGLDVPNPYRVVIYSAVFGVLTIGLYLMSLRLGGILGWMFQKEGPLELLTAMLELAAAAWSVAAARRWYRRGRPFVRSVPTLYVLLGVVLFLVAMEELNWGQTLFAFETPPSWAAINYQQETSLHNLLSMQSLAWTQHVLAALFGAGALGLIALAIKVPRSMFVAIAPAACVAPVAVLCALGGAFLHSEVFELLFAIFFAFYSFRIFVAAGSRSIVEPPALA